MIEELNMSIDELTRDETEKLIVELRCRIDELEEELRIKTSDCNYLKELIIRIELDRYTMNYMR